MLLLSKTLKTAGFNLISCLIVMFLVVLQFSHCGVLLFYIRFKDFKTLANALGLLLTISVGKFPSSNRLDISDRVVLAFLISFALFNMIVLMNIFIAIINEGFARAKEDTMKKKNYFEMLDYLVRRLKDRAIKVGLLKDGKQVQKLDDDFEDSVKATQKKLDKIDEIIGKWLRSPKRDMLQ
ncbi:polycystin-2-like [Ptychodera flava]|uniref:polycystin-2-like n=1 Tax=Ptychodera flava TaxID=63121 RepID=UPI00396A1911